MNATGKVVTLAGAAALAFFLLTAHRSVPNLPQAAPDSRPAATALRPQTPAPIAALTKPAARDLDDGAFVEICGLGKVRLAQDDPDGTAIVAARSVPEQSRWLAALQLSSDSRARAVALILADGDQSEALAGLALQGDDPALYDIAASACSRAAATSTACGQISPQAWTQLDADNAAAWLQSARQSRLAGDAAGERAAVARAAAAHFIEDYNFSLLAYSQASIPADVGVAVWNFLAGEALGIGPASDVSGYLEASKYCSKEAVSDPRVAEQCRAIAELLDTQGKNIVDLVFAKSIGARAGWSKERVELATSKVEALMAVAERLEPVDGASRWGCGPARASNEYLREVARRGGEVAALRDRLEQSGDSTPELALRHRQYIERLMGHAGSATTNEAPRADPQ